MYPRFHLKKLNLVEAATKHQVPSLKILGYQNQDVLKTSNHTGEHIKHNKNNNNVIHKYIHIFKLHLLTSFRNQIFSTPFLIFFLFIHKTVMWRL